MFLYTKPFLELVKMEHKCRRFGGYQDILFDYENKVNYGASKPGRGDSSWLLKKWIVDLIS